MKFITIFVLAGLFSLWMRWLRRKPARRVALTALALISCFTAMIWGGPLSSGALFLLLPAPSPAAQYVSPARYEPLHQGHVDLSTGLYIREDEDIVLTQSPSFVWRRAYLSRDRAKRRLGIGTTHNADWYLVGDNRTLKRIELVRENGSRIGFDRTSRGTSYVNAIFLHTETPSVFYGARLGWVGHAWGLRFYNGALALFHTAGSGTTRASLLASLRNPYGETIHLHRDAEGLLQRLEAGAQHVRFDYDNNQRIVRAVHGQHMALYSYDHLGRLERATVDGIVRTYSYGSRDEMLTIDEPGRSIENTYDDSLRLTRQVVRRPQHPDYEQAFAYTVEGEKVLETAVTQNDGTVSVYRWNEQRYKTLEIHEAESDSPVMVQYARPDDIFTVAVTIFCTKDGRRVTETVEVIPGEEDRTKAELIRRLCN